MSVLRRAALATVATAAAAMAMAPSATAAVQADTPSPGKGKGVVMQADPRSGYCEGWGDDGYSWWANCRVNSGYARAHTWCSDGTHKIGPWVGVGYWRFGGECYPHRLVDYGAEFVG